MEETITCLLDGARGIYIPQAFVECFDPAEWGITDDEDIRILLNGPDEEYYWDVWDQVLLDAEHTDRTGRRWTLYQEQDLFAVRDDHNWEDE